MTEMKSRSSVRPVPASPPPTASSGPWEASSDTPLATVRLTGALGSGNVRMLGRRMAELIRSGHRYLVLDLSAVDDVAPICVGVFNRAVAELRQLEGTLTLRGLDRATIHRLSGAGLHPSVSLFPRA